MHESSNWPTFPVQYLLTELRRRKEAAKNIDEINVHNIFINVFLHRPLKNVTGGLYSPTQTCSDFPSPQAFCMKNAHFNDSVALNAKFLLAHVCIGRKSGKNNCNQTSDSLLKDNTMRRQLVELKTLGRENKPAG